MRSAIISKIMIFIDNNSYSKADLEKMRYGLECIYIFITKGIIIFSLAFILGIIKYTLSFTIAFGIIRPVACGLHASKSWICMVSSLLLFLFIPYLCKILIINNVIRLILMSISGVLICIYAPADTKKRPIINKNKRLRLKILSTVIAIIYIITSLFIKENYILNSLMFSLILETIIILPITYRVFKLPYNNYINYLKSHNLEGRV